MTITNPSASSAPRRIVATREEAAAAFDEWQRRYEADPDAFGDPDATYGEDCADFLIELLEAARA